MLRDQTWSRREESCMKPSLSARRDGRIELLLSRGRLDASGFEGKTRKSALDKRRDEITRGVNIVREDEV